MRSGACVAEHGAIAVEFAIILPLLMLLILGIIDLGHMFYIEHLVTNASREGARYGAKYTRIPTSDPTSAQITDYVKSTLVTALDNLVASPPLYLNWPGPPTYKIVTVSVPALKHWWVLGTFNFYGWVPFPNPPTMTGTTSIKVEF